METRPNANRPPAGPTAPRARRAPYPPTTRGPAPARQAPRPRTLYTAAGRLPRQGPAAGGGPPRRRSRRRGASTLATALALVLVVAVGVGVFFAVRGLAGTGSPTPPQDSAGGVAPTGAEPTGGPPWVIALDGGHGGKDVGATGHIGEIELIEPTVAALYALLEADPDFTPVLTRGYGEGGTNTQRTQVALGAGAALLLSIHGNSDGSEDSNGFECFPVPPGRTWHAASLRFAGLLAEEMGAEGARLRGEGGVRYLYFDLADNRKVHEVSDTTAYPQQTFGILEKADYVAVLAEQCFVTNAADVAAFAGQEGCARAAGCYYRAIRRFFDAL